MVAFLVSNDHGDFAVAARRSMCIVSVLDELDRKRLP